MSFHRVVTTGGSRRGDDGPSANIITILLYVCMRYIPTAKKFMQPCQYTRPEGVNFEFRLLLRTDKFSSLSEPRYKYMRAAKGTTHCTIYAILYCTRYMIQYFYVLTLY